MDSNYNFSIITPSYNNLNFISLCSASIYDQQGVTYQHIIVDGKSNDGTVEWLNSNNQATIISEKDEGMYEAINKGLQLSKGDYIAILNADEQYLKDTLLNVKAFFENNPKVDIVFGDTLIIDEQGNLISYRKTIQPRTSYIFSSYLYILTCSIFFRRKIFDQGCSFNTKLKAVSDADFILRLLKHNYKFAHIEKYLAAFTITGKNKSINPSTLVEARDFFKKSPLWIKVFNLPLNLLRLVEKFLNGCYWQKFPLEYEIFTNENSLSKKKIKIIKASYRLRW
jgi:glycosyltransferase involved in cell wall biosynthesis